jgi:hypothetical protein
LTELEEVIEYAELGREAAAGQNGHHGKFN